MIILAIGGFYFAIVPQIARAIGKLQYQIRTHVGLRMFKLAVVTAQALAWEGAVEVPDSQPMTTLRKGG